MVCSFVIADSLKTFFHFIFQVFDSLLLIFKYFFNQISENLLYHKTEIVNRTGYQQTFDYI